MADVQVQPPKEDIPLYPVRSSSASSVSSSYSSTYSSTRRVSGGDHPALADAVERLINEGNVGQIARLALKTGIPSSQRAEAWPMLLRSHPYVTNPCIAHEFPVAPEPPREKRLRGDIKRLMQKTSRSLPQEEQEVLADSIFAAVWSFLTKYTLQYEAGFAWVGWTLATTMNQSAVDPTIFEHAMLVLLHTEPAMEPRGPGDSDVANTISRFMTVFRHFLPELSGHFDHEFMLNFFVGDEWLVWWMKWFGVKAFALPDLARLWDSYFGYRTADFDSPDDVEAATPFTALPSVAVEPRTLHVFACLAIMKANANKLMELDQSEAHHMLTHMPAMKNFEAVLIEAHGLLDKWKSLA